MLKVKNKLHKKSKKTGTLFNAKEYTKSYHFIVWESLTRKVLNKTKEPSWQIRPNLELWLRNKVVKSNYCFNYFDF
jgi:hypothetical protein